MSFAAVCRWLIAEHHLSIDQIADLTDDQIERLYLPEPKAEAKAGKSPYERYRDCWLRRGRSIEEIDTLWRAKEQARRRVHRAEEVK